MLELEQGVSDYLLRVSAIPVPNEVCRFTANRKVCKGKELTPSGMDVRH